MRARRDFRGAVAAAVVAAAVVIALGITTLWWLTWGFSSFTSESWRRAAVIDSPRPLPNALLQNAAGQTFPLHSLCGRVLVVNFVYTQCATVCKAVGSESAQLATRLRDVIDAGQATVLSVSFDPLRDTPSYLTRFKQAMESTPTSWQLARTLTQEELLPLLETFGVAVIPDGIGGFDHNAALHVVDRSCRLSRVLDLGDIDQTERQVRELL